MSLHAFQASFHAALRADPASGALPGFAAQPGFAVYRNTVLKGGVDALAANYPAARAFVGDEWFRAAAACYVREWPPTQPMLTHYGASFADFLRRFPPAAALPCLPAVARLDRHWTEAHLAPAAPRADAAQLATRAPTELATLRLRPHPAARWAWFDDVPAFSLWQVNRGEVSMPPGGLDAIPWRSEGALTTRPHDAVQVTPIPLAACTLLDACAHGATLATAASVTLAADPGLDFAALIAQLLTAGAFAHAEPLPQPMEPQICPRDQTSPS